MRVARLWIVWCWQPNAAGAGQRRQRQPLAGQKDVLQAQELDVVLDRLLEGGDMPAVHLDRLPRRQVQVSDLAVDLQEERARPGRSVAG